MNLLINQPCKNIEENAARSKINKLKQNQAKIMKKIHLQNI